VPSIYKALAFIPSTTTTTKKEARGDLKYMEVFAQLILMLFKVT
jgi:hypothetical protein